MLLSACSLRPRWSGFTATASKLAVLAADMPNVFVDFSQVVDLTGIVEIGADKGNDRT